MKDLRIIDSLGSAQTMDGRYEAICWTHRGSGWDVHDTSGSGWGRSCRTKSEAYALLRRLARQGGPRA